MEKEVKIEINENSLEFSRQFKSWLRFNIGDIVYLKSDLNRTHPMTVSSVYPVADWADYYLVWFNSQNTIEESDFYDKTLMK